MTASWITQLQDIPLFAELPPAALTELAQHMTVQTFTPEAWIVREGDAGDSLFIVTHGVVSVLKSGGGVMMELLDLLRAGDLFGEMSLFLHEPRSASVQAVMETTCAMLTYAQFESFQAKHPAAGQMLYRRCIAGLAERLRDATNRLDPLRGADALRISADVNQTPALLPEAFGARLALIQGMGELLATAPLAPHEQERCRAVLREQLAALQQGL